jgi:hypothetical protein
MDLTLKRLSCSTFLIAMSSFSFSEPTSLAWKTTPNEPFPITLQLVYEISLVSADLPSEAITLTTLWGSSMALTARVMQENYRSSAIRNWNEDEG